MESPADSERSQAAFANADGTDVGPSDRIMYEPSRSGPVTDSFGTEIMI